MDWSELVQDGDSVVGSCEQGNEPLGFIEGRESDPLCNYQHLKKDSASCSWFFIRERTPGTHWIGGWMGLKAGVDTEARRKMLCLCWGSNPGHPVVQSVLRHCTD
jgi:hypothetical protein